jgi:hypothetical protein
MKTPLPQYNTGLPLAELVYIQAIRKEIEARLSNRYRKRIDHLVEANNELMKELEQWEKGKRPQEKATLSPEEEQIVRMPWLKEHTNG